MSKSGPAIQHKPKHVISRRNTQPHPIEQKSDGPHRTLEDWDKQELRERSVTRPADNIGEWVGVPHYYANHSELTWRDDHRQAPEVVSRYYPHEKLIVDLPNEQEDTQRRIDLFERLGIKYMYVEVEEEMDEAQFKRRLKRVRENHEKAIRRLAGPGMRRAS